MATEDAPRSLTKVREACLARGAAGIKGMGRTFRIFDDNGSKTLDFDEFKTGLDDYKVNDLTQTEMKDLFNYFDSGGDGTVKFDEFLIALRPPMNKHRVDLVKLAFRKLDADSSGDITVKDLLGTYKADFHPKYKSGEWTKKQVLQEFLNSYQADTDDTVTWEEFLNYYSGVSASIDQDVYFDLMMRQCWKL